MNEKAFKELIDSIVQNKIHILDLNGKNLDESQTKALIEALSKNMSIYSVNLERCLIPEIAKKTIEEIINKEFRQFLIGWMIDKGQMDLKCNDETKQATIIQCYSKAAVKGVHYAQYNLAVMKSSKIIQEYDQSYNVAVMQNSKILQKHKPKISKEEAQSGWVLFRTFHLFNTEEVKEISEIAKLVEKASSQGLKEAEYLYGLLHLDGWKVNYNLDEAIKLIEKAAYAGLTVAQLELGWLYQRGQLITENTQKALELYYMAHNLGDINSSLYIAIHYILNNKRELGVKHLKILIENGNKQALNIKEDIIPKLYYRYTQCEDQKSISKFNRHTSRLTLDDEVYSLSIVNEFELNGDRKFQTVPDGDISKHLNELVTKDRCEEYLNWIRIPTLDAPLINGQSLIKSLEFGNFDFAKKLLALPNINVNLTGENDLTPFQIAKKENQPEIVQLILRSPGFDVNKNNLLVTALENADFELAKKLLAHPDIKINVVGTNNLTPLQLALVAAESEIVDIILSKPDLNINMGYPIIRAAADGLDYIVKKFLAIPSINVNCIVSLGSPTPLWIAAKNGREQVVRLLLDSGKVQIDYQCSKLMESEQSHFSQVGKTSVNALEIAKFYGHNRIVKLIQNKKETLILSDKDSKKRKAETENNLQPLISQIQHDSNGTNVPVVSKSLPINGASFTNTADNGHEQKPKPVNQSNSLSLGGLNLKTKEESKAELDKPIEERFKNLENHCEGLTEQLRIQQRQNEELTAHIKELTFLFSSMAQQGFGMQTNRNPNVNSSSDIKDELFTTDKKDSKKTS